MDLMVTMKKPILKQAKETCKSILSFIRTYFPKDKILALWKFLKHEPLFWVGISLIAALVLFAIVKSLLSAPVGEYAIVEKGDFAVDMVEAGEVQALSERLISAPETRLEQIQVIKLTPEGAMVKKGDFLAQMDAGDLETQESLAVDRLAVARANYQKILAQQSLIMHSYENNLKLYQYNYEQAQLRIQAMQYEAETKKEEARLQLKQAEIDLNRVKQQLVSQKIIQTNERIQNEATIRQVQNEIRSLRDQISKMVIKAPTDGMVIYQEVGSWQSRERLKEGYKARHGEAILSIPDLSRVQIQLYVNEVDRSQVLPGQPAEIVLDAFPKIVFHGKVQGVSRLAQNVRGNSKLKGFVVLINIEESDSRLKPGMSAKARIVLDSLKNVMTVPLGVVHEINGKPVVFRRGKTKPSLVTLGSRNDSRVVVLKGLKAGMKLAWHPENLSGGIYGTAEEKRRIALAAANLEQGMSKFEQKGTLYDYANPNKSRRRMQKQSPSQGDEGMQNMLRQYLQRQGGKEQTGGVQITPEMMDRMGAARTQRQKNDTAGVRRRTNTRQNSGRQGAGGNGQAGPSAGSQDGSSFEITPEMRERFRAMRQQRRQEESGGNSQGAEGQGGSRGDGSSRRRTMRGDSTGGGNFEMTPEMLERMRQWRQRQDADTSSRGRRGMPENFMREIPGQGRQGSDTTSNRRRQE
jgi:RND family efflux transporter MFP subunit